MVLEAIIGVSGARKHPAGMLILSSVLASVALWISYFTFPGSASMMALALTTIALMPILHRLFVVEEAEEARCRGSAATFIGRHFDIISIYAFFFIGVVIAYAFWYVVLPPASASICAADTKALECLIPTRDSVFSEQERTWQGITSLRESATAAVTAMTTGYSANSCLGSDAEKSILGCTIFIFTNNALVLGLAILFSFLYGAGVIFLLSWNASVIGIFIGKEIVEQHLIAGIARAIGYLPHGIFEIGAYFIGAIAGGIISVALSKRSCAPHELERITKDVLLLLVVAYAAVLLGALVEAYLIVGSG